MAAAKTTTDHATIRRWTEEREGFPATVSETTEDTAGVLRIGFRDESETPLEEIGWEKFFQKFDAENLQFLYQERTDDGKVSRFNKLVAEGE